MARGGKILGQPSSLFSPLGLAFLLGPLGLIFSVLLLPGSLPDSLYKSWIQLTFSCFLIFAGAWVGRVSGSRLLWRSVAMAFPLTLSVAWMAVLISPSIGLALPAETDAFGRAVSWQFGPVVVSIHDLRKVSVWLAFFMVGLLGERKLRGSGLERWVLWIFVIAATPFIIKSARVRLAGVSLGFWLASGFLMLVGVSLLLWDPEQSELPLRATFVGAASFLGLAVLALSPGASQGLAAALRVFLSLLGFILNLALKPVGYLAEFLITKIQALMRFKPEPPEMPSQPGPNEDLMRKMEEAWKTPLVMKALGWVLLALVLGLSLYLFWKFLKKRHDPDSERMDEEREREWSREEALRWAAAAVKKLTSRILPRSRKSSRAFPRAEIGKVYFRFLEACEKAGCSRMPHETPLEFAKVLALNVPEVEPEALAISKAFSSYFYSGRTPEPGELDSLRKTLIRLETHLSVLQSKQPPQDPKPFSPAGASFASPIVHSPDSR